MVMKESDRRIALEGFTPAICVPRIWQVEEQVLSRDATSIEMAFDLSSVRAGQTGTFVQAVQVTDAGDQGCIVKSGTNALLTATPDDRTTGQHYAATAL